MTRIRTHRFAAVLGVVALLAGCAQPGSSLEPPGRPGSSLEPPGRPGSGPEPLASRPPGPVGETQSGEAGPATCPPEGVRLETDEGDAAMGLRVLGITLVNCGTRTYRLNGYPLVRSLGEDRDVLTVQVLQGVEEIVGSDMPWDGPPKPVVLRAGQRAGSAVAWRNTYDDIREPPVTVRFLDIAPLAGRPSQILEPRGGLDLGSTGRIGISAWSPLPDGDSMASPAGPPVPGASASEPVETGGPLP